MDELTFILPAHTRTIFIEHRTITPIKAKLPTLVVYDDGSATFVRAVNKQYDLCYAPIFNCQSTGEMCFGDEFDGEATQEKIYDALFFRCFTYDYAECVEEYVGLCYDKEKLKKFYESFDEDKLVPIQSNCETDIKMMEFLKGEPR